MDSQIPTEEVIKDNPQIPQRKIKHLVLSGGNVWGFNMVGILEEAIYTGFLHMDDVETIHATSVGSIMAALFALKIEPQLLHEYIIKRPWDAVCKANRYSVLEIYDNRGIIHSGFIKDILSPILKSVDLPVDITLADFHKYNGIDFHIYSTELNRYELVDISFKTHPEWKLIDAVYASSSVPLFFSPLIRGDKCYVDGGFFLNYPISKCNVENKDEVLGISLGNLTNGMFKEPISESSNVCDVVSSALFSVINNNRLFSNDNTLDYPYQVVLYNLTTLESCIQALYTREEREHLVSDGRRELHTQFTKWFLQES